MFAAIITARPRAATAGAYVQVRKSALDYERFLLSEMLSVSSLPAPATGDSL